MEEITFEQKNSRSLREFLGTQKSLSITWNTKGNGVQFADMSVAYVTDNAKPLLKAGQIDSLVMTDFKKSGTDVWVTTIHVNGFKAGETQVLSL